MLYLIPVVLALFVWKILIPKYIEYWQADAEASLENIASSWKWLKRLLIVSLIFSVFCSFGGKDFTEGIIAFLGIFTVLALLSIGLILLIHLATHFMSRCPHCRAHSSRNVLTGVEFLRQEWRTETVNNSRTSVPYIVEMNTLMCERCGNSWRKESSRKA